MKVKWLAQEYGIMACVYPLETGEEWSDRPQCWVTVERKREFGSHINGIETFEDATINWSAVGNTDIETADYFAKAMQKAVYIAKEMMKPIKHYKVTIQLLDRDQPYETIVLANSRYQISCWLENESIIADGNYVSHNVECLDKEQVAA